MILLARYPGTMDMRRSCSRFLSLVVLTLALTVWGCGDGQGAPDVDLDVPGVHDSLPDSAADGALRRDRPPISLATAPKQR